MAALFLIKTSFINHLNETTKGNITTILPSTASDQPDEQERMELSYSVIATIPSISWLMYLNNSPVLLGLDNITGSR